MRKKPNRPTPDESAAQRASFEELEQRIRGLTTELEAAGSAYARVGLDDQLAYAIGRLDAELAAKRQRRGAGSTVRQDELPSAPALRARVGPSVAVDAALRESSPTPGFHVPLSDVESAPGLNGRLRRRSCGSSAWIGRKRRLARTLGARHAGAVDPRRLLARLARGDLANVSFADMRALVQAFGFELKRTSGSHHIFVRLDVPELINLQDVHGQAKPYQIRQFLGLVDRYALSMEEGQ